MRKIIFLAAIVILAVAFWLYYPRTPEGPYKITVGAVGSSPHTLIYTAMADLGIDKKYNLELNIKYSAPGEVERQARDREVDVGASSIFSVAEDNTKGLDIRIFGPLFYSPNVLVARTDSRFEKVEDLPGARLAVPPKASAAFAGLDLVARTRGVMLEQRTSILFGGLPQNAAALASGEAHVALFSWPDVANSLVSPDFRSIGGLHPLWKESKGTPFSFIGLTAYQDWLDANPDAARSLISAIIETNKEIKRNPDLISQYADSVNLKSSEAVNLAKENLPDILMDSWGAKDLTDIEFVVSEMVRLGILAEEPPDGYLVILR